MSLDERAAQIRSALERLPDDGFSRAQFKRFALRSPETKSVEQLLLEFTSSKRASASRDRVEVVLTVVFALLTLTGIVLTVLSFVIPRSPTRWVFAGFTNASTSSINDDIASALRTSFIKKQQEFVTLQSQRSGKHTNIEGMAVTISREELPEDSKSDLDSLSSNSVVINVPDILRWRKATNVKGDCMTGTIKCVIDKTTTDILRNSTSSETDYKPLSPANATKLKVEVLDGAYLQDASATRDELYLPVERAAVFKRYDALPVRFMSVGFFMVLNSLFCGGNVLALKSGMLTSSGKAWFTFWTCFGLFPLCNHALMAYFLHHVRMDHFTVFRYVITCIFDVMVSWSLTDLLVTSIIKSRDVKHPTMVQFSVLACINIVTFFCNSGLMRDAFVSPHGPSMFFQNTDPIPAWGIVLVSNAVVCAFVGQSAMSTSDTGDRRLRLFLSVLMFLLLSVGFVMGVIDPMQSRPDMSQMMGYVAYASTVVACLLGIVYSLIFMNNKKAATSKGVVSVI